MTKTNNVRDRPNVDDSNDVRRPISRRPVTRASTRGSAPQEGNIQAGDSSSSTARTRPQQNKDVKSRIAYWTNVLKEALLHPEVVEVRTNIRGPGDHRPLPRGIRPIPPPARPRTRAATRGGNNSTKSRRPAPQPRPPTIRPRPRPRVRARPILSAAERRARIDEVHARIAAEDRGEGLKMTRVRDNMPHYVQRYPKAVQVRIRLGADRWEAVEFERCRIAYFACMIRQLDREDDSPPRADLDRQLPTLKAYVRRTCGDRMADVFQYLHDNRESMLADEAAMGVPIQHGRVMSEIRELFHREPYLWFVYNMYFPVRPGPLHEWSGRMNWKQLQEWALWAFQHSTEQPSWYAYIRPEDLVLQPTTVSAADSLWNDAMIEAFNDAASRFDGK